MILAIFALFLSAVVNASSFLPDIAEQGGLAKVADRHSVLKIVDHFEQTEKSDGPQFHFYPAKELFFEYVLEKTDNRHRVGFTVDPARLCLLRKWQQFKTIEAAHQNVAWCYHGGFWQWLDDEADGKKIPSVLYLKPKERSAYQVKFEGNSIHSIILDNLKKSRVEGLLEVMFVMDRRGNFYVAPKDRGSADKSAFQHSSFFSGQPVSGAGLFVIDLPSLEIKKYNRLSGHYRFGLHEIAHVFESLARAYVNLDAIEFDLGSLEYSDFTFLRDVITKEWGKQTISISEWQAIAKKYLSGG